MCHMENMDFVERLPCGYVSHGKHGLCLTPTLRECVTWKTWTLFNAYPAGMCHMKTWTLFNAYPAGMCHMKNMDFV